MKLFGKEFKYNGFDVLHKGNFDPATGNVATSTKLQTARTINGVSFDGSSNITITANPNSHNHDVSNITTGNWSTDRLGEPAYSIGSVTRTARPLFDVLRGDRTAFLPESQIIIEQSIDGGVTWVDANVSDTIKRKLFTGQRPSILIPLKNGVKDTDCMIRITITGMRYDVPVATPEIEKYNYWNSTYVKSTERYFSAEEGWAWVSSNSDRIYLKVERATGANSNSWSLDREAYLTGWSGGNYFSLSGSTFGGGTTQTGNTWNWRFTFRTCSPSNTFNNADLSTIYTTSAQSIHHIKIGGKNVWSYSNNYMYNDHIYTWDEYQNTFFSNEVRATTFKNTSGTEVSYVGHVHTKANITDFSHTHTKSEVGLGNVDNTADSTKVVASAAKLTTARTINGVSFDGSANITITANPNAHSHIITDVTGLQAALDGKAASSHGNHVPTTESANNAKFLRNDNSWQLVTPANIGAMATSHAANSITGFGTNGTATTVARSDHGHNDYAPLASPALTGAPTAPTATPGTNTTQIATTAFVQAAMTAAGAGDMTKSTYDKNNNGIVDRAETADKLTTARTINGVSFDGSANITVADSTKLPLAGGTMSGAITLINGAMGLHVGDDASIGDINMANAIGLQGKQDPTTVKLVFGSGQDTSIYRSGANELSTGILRSNNGVKIGGDRLDASLHIQSIFGNNGRLTQMSPSTANTNGLNLMSSRNSSNTDQWWSWGVGTDNYFHFCPGVNTFGFGVHISPEGSVLANGKVQVAGKFSMEYNSTENSLDFVFIG